MPADSIPSESEVQTTTSNALHSSLIIFVCVSIVFRQVAGLQWDETEC